MGCASSKTIQFDALPTVGASESAGNPAAKETRMQSVTEVQLASRRSSAEMAAKEALASTVVQSHFRGKRDRARVDAMLRPCGTYQLNLNAKNFGECACGWAKADHTADAFKPKAKMLPLTKRTSVELRATFVQKQHTGCAKYQVNLQSANFGECICGIAKADHTPEALAVGGADARQKGRVSDEEVRVRMLQKEHASCVKYEADVAAAGFGTCLCGRPRAEHSPMALQATVDKSAGLGTTRKDSGEVRATMAQRATVECERYEVAVGDHTAAFGACARCSEPRAAHSEAALHAATNREKSRKMRDSAEVRKGFATTAAWDERSTIDCPFFDLDLSPTAAFGMCKCGQSKAKHSAEAIAGRMAPSGPSVCAPCATGEA